MKNIDWNDLRIFAHVARGGGLTAAAQELGSSPATIGRRMLALERSIGRTLFVRRQTGYELTDEGRALLEKAQAMESSARPIEAWASAGTERPVVRISTGTWVANFLAANFARLWTPDDAFRIAFKTGEARFDIAHRAIDIGVRNRAPDGANLAGRLTGEVAYAPFQARNAPRRDEWVAVAPEDASTPSMRWINARTDLTIAAWANTPRTLYDLIRTGAGQGVLPCFAGDRDPLLERAGDEIAELRHSQFIVMHDDDRHRPEVRRVVERMAALFAAHRALFAGGRPLGGE